MLPLLSSSILCSVTALKDKVKYFRQGKEDPLFLIPNWSSYKPLIVHGAHSFLKLSVVAIGLNPRHFTFHSFTRSGVTLAFDNDDHIKQHGNWNSDSMGVFELAATSWHYSSEVSSTTKTYFLAFLPLGSILSSSLGRFTDGNILLNKLNAFVL